MLIENTHHQFLPKFLNSTERHWMVCFSSPAIHWELIVVIERENQSELLWVQPLKVKHSSNSTETTATVNNGRTETNHAMSLSRIKKLGKELEMGILYQLYR